MVLHLAYPVVLIAAFVVVVCRPKSARWSPGYGSVPAFSASEAEVNPRGVDGRGRAVLVLKATSELVDVDE
jgi:hypothetical protein